MTNLRNELPIAVHLASGGNARIRTGGQVVAFDQVSSGSVQLTGATGFRGSFSARSTGGVLLLIGYATPLTHENASWVISDFGQFSDDAPEGTTVHFRLVSSDNLEPANGGALDAVYVSFYA